MHFARNFLKTGLMEVKICAKKTCNRCRYQDNSLQIH
eukprot:UN06182